jgi:hypothetical protein
MSNWHICQQQRLRQLHGLPDQFVCGSARLLVVSSLPSQLVSAVAALLRLPRVRQPVPAVDASWAAMSRLSDKRRSALPTQQDHTGGSWSFGLAKDSQGNIYYIPPGGYEVRVISPTGYSLRALNAFPCELYEAQAVAVDRSDNVFVLTLGSSGSNCVLQLGGTSGDFVATDYTPYPYLGQLSQMALDACGNVYVADPENGRIVEFILHPGCSNAALAAPSPAVGNAPPPYVNYPLPNPTGVAVDRNGNVFGLDGNNGSIVQFPVTGGATAAYPLTALPDLINGLIIDGCGQLYVTDITNDVV